MISNEHSHDAGVGVEGSSVISIGHRHEAGGGGGIYDKQ